jgi:hypothetical protein
MKYKQKPQIAIMRNGTQYYLEFLAYSPSSANRDDTLKMKDNFVTAITIEEKMTLERFNKLDRLAKEGLDYLAQELSFS